MPSQKFKARIKMKLDKFSQKSLDAAGKFTLKDLLSDTNKKHIIEYVPEIDDILNPKAAKETEEQLSLFKE